MTESAAPPQTDGGNEVRLTRGSTLRRIGGVGAAVFTALAARGTGAAQASNWACCDLAYPNSSQWCTSNGYGNWLCPTGFTKMSWYCCVGTTLYGCGECQYGGTTCFNGSAYACSYGWVAASGGC